MLPYDTTPRPVIQALRSKASAFADEDRQGQKYRFWANQLEDCHQRAVRRVECEQCGWHHDVPKLCGLRTCQKCAKRNGNRIRRRYLKPLQSKSDLKFWTLTMMSTDDPATGVWRLRKCLEKFRRRASIKRCFRGGLAAIESGTPKMVNGKWMYPIHCHLIISADWRPQEWVSKLWQEVTGDSWVVDVRWIKDVKHELSYVLAYSAKSCSSPKWNPEAAIKFMEATEGKRLLQPFGFLLGSAERDEKFYCPDCGEAIWIIIDLISNEVIYSETDSMKRYLKRLTPT